MADERQSILYLRDGDLPDKMISVRLQGGLRAENLTTDLMNLERRARLIIEQHKRGEWQADEGPQMPKGF